MGEIRTVLKGEEIPESKLREILQKANLLDDVNSNIDLQQFSSGYSNLTYLITTDQKEYVLRRPPFGAVKRGHDMGREYKVLNALQGHFKKIPKVYFFDESELLGVPFYIMEKVNGVIVRNEKLVPESYGEISDKWLDTFVELHALDYKEVGLEDFARPIGYVERQVRNWSKQYIAAKTKEVKAAAVVMDWMAANQVESEEHCLIHNDFRFDNVIFKDDTWSEVAAVLDWEMATIGDPLMDLGTTLGYWTMASDPEFLQKGLPSSTVYPGNLSRSELVSEYARRSGREIDHIIFYYVYGLFKIAVIAQQIYYRYKKGLTTDPKFAGLEAASEGLCMMALQAIEKKKIENLF
ncbi:phosphotransferase family protein [Portibacter lacus]|uniref:Phosphotransferase family protein n=1 Tax=Portibacter lacus TaxID=1099794 RepID=A0AA37SRP3_9BACT|nr:phosphotransferase family protein [Portibacter lacus]GLR18757.1 phosphotransferase family protein [Portibacter lacus]